jgi:Phospholipase C
MGHLYHADQFYRDLEEGTLPAFSYINPECCTIDSMHPTSPMASGEPDDQAPVLCTTSLKVPGQRVSTASDPLCQDINAHSLLIINFDEHGGFADHVPPPMNVPQPEDKISYNGKSEDRAVTYDFTRLGVRYVWHEFHFYGLRD